MCGIGGVFDRRAATSADDLGKVAGTMAEALVHRGPDDEGVWVDEAAGVALGHRRLAVVDLSATGHQPMVSPSGRYVISYNGEIYNHGELRREVDGLRGTSDTEVLLAACDHHGVRGALDRVNGMFAFACWDRQERALWLVRDRLGEKPLYLAVAGDRVWFASELKALRACPDLTFEVDRDALALFFRHKYVPAPHTIYRGVEKVRPAEAVVVTAGGIRRERYWDPTAFIPPGGVAAADREAGLAELDQILADAVARRMVADVPVGAFLSGGVDSSVVVALMQEASERPVRTFTIGNTDPRFDEAEAAEAVAHHLGTDHTTLRVTGDDALAVVPELADLYDEPFADSSQIPTALVCRLARQHVTVALSGDGGDELFGGYNRYRWVPAIWRRTARLPAPLRRAGAAGLAAIPPGWVDRAADLLPERRRPRLLGTKVAKVASVAGAASPEAMFLRLTSHWDEPERLVKGSREPATLVSSPEDWPAASSLATRMMAVDLVTYLPDDILTKLDRASMAVSLEARVPLLDHRVVEHAVRHDGFVGSDGPAKGALRAVADRHLPPGLLDRPKMGFGVPVGEWLRGPLREWAGDLLSPARLRQDGYLDEALVTRAWREHLGGRRDHTYRLWDVVVFQSWLDRWHPSSSP